MKLSAVIITLNEEKNLDRCLKSLSGIADEIVVVDSFSIDRTADIAHNHGAVFIRNKFEGHIQQKNFALAQAQFDWILSLDADEALDDILRISISEVKRNGIYPAYTMNRLTNYCGKWIRHCGWYPDTKLRLVRKQMAQWTGVNPHDKLELIKSENVGHLKGDILHYSYYSKQDHYTQIEFFGKIAAREMYQRGIKVSRWLTFIKVLAQFIKSFFIKAGFMDGRAGWHISIRSAFATYRKYELLRKEWNSRDYNARS